MSSYTYKQQKNSQTHQTSQEESKTRKRQSFSSENTATHFRRNEIQWFILHAFLLVGFICSILVVTSCRFVKFGSLPYGLFRRMSMTSVEAEEQSCISYSSSDVVIQVSRAFAFLGIYFGGVVMLGLWVYHLFFVELLNDFYSIFNFGLGPLLVLCCLFECGTYLLLLYEPPRLKGTHYETKLMSDATTVIFAFTFYLISGLMLIWIPRLAHSIFPCQTHSPPTKSKASPQEVTRKNRHEKEPEPQQSQQEPEVRHPPTQPEQVQEQHKPSLMISSNSITQSTLSNELQKPTITSVEIEQSPSQPLPTLSHRRVSVHKSLQQPKSIDIDELEAALRDVHGTYEVDTDAKETPKRHQQIPSQQDLPDIDIDMFIDEQGSKKHKNLAHSEASSNSFHYKLSTVSMLGSQFSESLSLQNPTIDTNQIYEYANSDVSVLTDDFRPGNLPLPQI